MRPSKVALSGIQTVQGSCCKWLSVSTAPFRLSVSQSVYLSTLTSMPAPVASRVGNRPDEITPGLWNSTRTDSGFVSLPEGPIQGREGPNRRLTVVRSGQGAARVSSPGGSTLTLGRSGWLNEVVYGRRSLEQGRGEVCKWRWLAVVIHAQAPGPAGQALPWWQRVDGRLAPWGELSCAGLLGVE